MENLKKIQGKVIQGQKLGKKYGLPPTMNIEISSQLDCFQNLEQGIYCVKIRRIEGGVSSEEGKWLSGVAHYGTRPAVHAGESFEVHVFDFNEDWYGQQVEVLIGAYLRPVMNFASIEELKRQIEKDIEQAKEMLQ